MPRTRRRPERKSGKRKKVSQRNSHTKFTSAHRRRRSNTNKKSRVSRRRHFHTKYREIEDKNTNSNMQHNKTQQIRAQLPRAARYRHGRHGGWSKGRLSDQEPEIRFFPEMFKQIRKWPKNNPAIQKIIFVPHLPDLPDFQICVSDLHFGLKRKLKRTWSMHVAHAYEPNAFQVAFQICVSD